ncbi:GLE1-domain-containing protein [Hypoxylon trugodes]|uniref:GLE1-domain-containing protein n=1 Tax=Hypoxylon trugodes TaxID=326681 RepID=UPI0021A1EAEE|nr:GLE1-domain-containing protein [Hypoxylon trugodes]KAI1391370.1 GLE1-domain-containing protein [Hypoxylon trugodes]
MAGSSPATRRSRQWSNPLSSPLSEERNSALNHQDALAAALAEHDRVREVAIRVYHDYELQEERRRLEEQQNSILEQQRKEEELIRAKEQLRKEEERLRILKETKVPELPPAPPTPIPAVNGSALATKSATLPAKPAFQPTTAPAVSEAIQKPKSSLFGLHQPASQQSPLTNGVNGQANGTAGKVVEPSLPNTFSKPQAQLFSTQAKPATPPSNALSIANLTNSSPPANVDRYVQIHRNLKKLRASLLQQAKTSPLLKQRLGDMRRELRKNMGQLVGEKGANRTQARCFEVDGDVDDYDSNSSEQSEAIQALLNESLSGAVPSELIDPSDFVTDKREPVEGALRNEATLPSLFLYLLNHFAKAVINQFINECAAQAKNADPIGILVVMIFSKEQYSWRGKSLIDILMAKYRVACPVVFGYHGSEKTEKGRLLLGWKKTPGGWIPEQQHIDRMKALAAGFAAISLRNFVNSPNKNPYPPRNYWTAMAKIVNTPPAEVSDTQCVVLRSMIEESEEKFIQFYGNAAIAALRKALVEFPSTVVEKTPGVSGLQVLADLIKRDIGLEL